MDRKKEIKEVAALFFKLGSLAFGGPAAHIAMMREEVVRKRQWMTEERFLDLVGATNLIPGPNSTEMSMHCGHERAGWRGLLVAGGCFIFPAVLITGVFAYLYQLYGQLPQVEKFVYGIGPAVVAIIVAAIIPMARKALKTVELGILGVLVLLAAMLGLNEILAMFGAGLAGLGLYWLRKAGGGGGAGGGMRTGDSGAGSSGRPVHGKQFFSLVWLQVALPSLQIPAIKIFWVFFKIGALLYGSGYVLFAFLEAELVDKGLLSRQVMMDAIAVGQFTPGPVLSSATFVGWQLDGLSGALLATVAIFLPSFFFVALLNPLVDRMRRSTALSAFLDAVNMGSVAVIVAVCIRMAQTAAADWRSLLIMLAAFSLGYFRPRIHSAWIVVGGAAAGWLLQQIN